MSFTIRLALACLLVYLALPFADAEAQTTALFVDSQPGDPVGRGIQQTWLSGELTFSSFTDGSTPPNVFIEAANSTFPRTRWSLRFAAPTGRHLQPGTYEYARRWLGSASAMPGMAISGNALGCNSVTGRFVIYEVTFNPNGTVRTFAADFEQHCDDRTPALFGAIRFNAERSSLMPFDGAYPVYQLDVGQSANGYAVGPAIMCGAGHAQCSATYGGATPAWLEAVPNPGYVFVGWAGHCEGLNPVTLTVHSKKTCTPVFELASGEVGANPALADAALVIDRPSDPAARQVFSSEDTVFVAVVNSRRRVRILAHTPAASWRIEIGGRVEPLLLPFSAHASGGGGDAPLSPGLYEYASNVSGAPYPYLSVSECSDGGRFRLYELEIVGTTLVRLAADFECKSMGRALAGAIRYRSSRSRVIPFEGDYPNYTLRVVPSVGGSVLAAGIACGSAGGDCEQRFPGPLTIGLQAVAAPGYQFAAWSGACSGGNPETSVAVDGVKRCLAAFFPTAGGASDPSFADGTVYLAAPGATTGRSNAIWLAAVSSVSVGQPFYQPEFEAYSDATGGAYVAFGTPPGRVVPGTYEATVSEKFQDRFPVLLVSGCTPRTGRFTVYEATYDRNGDLSSFAADFEAHCTSATRPLVIGAIRYRSSRPAIRPFDGAYPLHKLTVDPAVNGFVVASGIACGPSRTDCSKTYAASTTVALRAVPRPGYRFVAWMGACSGESSTTLQVVGVMRCSAVFNAESPGAGVEDARLARQAFLVSGEAGESVSGGLKRAWLDAPPFVANFGGINYLNWTFRDGSWSIRLGASGNARLQPGTYDNAGGFSSSSSRPRIDISRSPSTGFLAYCHSPGAVIGSFRVYEVVYTGDVITSLAADFAQQCTATSPVLRGSIRFNSSRSRLIPFDTALSGGCTTPDPYINEGAGICANGQWSAPPPGEDVPAAAPTPSPSTCATPDPFVALGGGTCWNGGWLPPGMPIPEGPSPNPGACATPDPFVALGGGTCWNGGWLPPGMPIPGDPAPAPTPSPNPRACATPDPFVALGGGTCWNGGWLPPGMPVPGNPSPRRCVGPDPFASIPGLIGECRNGGWVPVPRGL